MLQKKLFYYALHCLKFSGMINDGFKKGLYITKNFFRKATYLNDIPQTNPDAPIKLKK